MLRKIIPVFFLLMTICRVHAQVPDPAVKLRLAQGLEQSGEYEKAARQYEDLMRMDPGNGVYFDGLRRMYLQLKKYDEAIYLLQQRLSAAPSDANLLCMLASTYYRAGKERDADESWEKAVAADPGNQNTYRLVATSQVENRLLDRAADTYRKAREACKDPTLFTLDLAQLLAVSMDYEGATKEFVHWVEKNPAQLPYVQSRMSTFTGKEDARKIAINVVRSEVGENPKLYELLGWLYFEGKYFDEAFEVYRLLDRKSGAHGASIASFADRAYKERAFQVAANAYREAINTPIPREKLPAAKYGYASALMQLSLLADTLSEASSALPETESQPRYTGAIAYFRTIISEYPRTEFSARSYYQIGLLQFERYFDLDGALQSFERAENETPSLPLLQYDVSLQMGELYVAKGDTARAASCFSRVSSASNATPDQIDEASFHLAEISYFGGEFQKAIDRLSEISVNTKADYANDAIQFLSFLQENKASGEALVRFSRADFLARQRKASEAIPILLQVLQQYPQAPLVDDALMKIARLQTQAGRYQEALESYQHLLKDFKESSIALDQAQFNIAEIYEKALKKTQLAITAYEQLLAAYPQSVLCNQARKRIRELRGDSL